jgi:S-methylmethionine-dependent homocysteine/selenocysteine methylase
MSPLWRAELARRALVIDGGTGSELRRRGFALRGDVWSALAAQSHYELLRGIHSDYIAAGADIVTTNTFATSRFVLEAAGYGAEFESINRRAVEAAPEAREAAGRAVAIAGSLSCLPPAFDRNAYPPAREEAAAYRALAELLAEAGVDFIVLEMLEETEHARLACAAARAVGLPFWLGLSCRAAGGRLVAFDFPAVAFEDCLEALLPFEPEGVAVMHSPASAVQAALETIRGRFSGPLGAYPALPAEGADEPALGAPLAPGELADAAVSWLRCGARIVGGCCGATPEHIAAVAAAIRLRSAVESD